MYSTLPYSLLQRTETRLCLSPPSSCLACMPSCLMVCSLAKDVPEYLQRMYSLLLHARIALYVTSNLRAHDHGGTGLCETKRKGSLALPLP